LNEARHLRRKSAAALAAVALSLASILAATAHADPFTRTVAITGDPIVGATLTAYWNGPGKGDWIWLSCPVADDAALADCGTIAGPNVFAADTYTVQPADVGQFLRAALVDTAIPLGVRGMSAAAGPVQPVATPPPTVTPGPGPSPVPAPAPPPVVATPAPIAAVSPPTPAPVFATLPRPTTPPAPRLMRPWPTVRVRGILTSNGAQVRLLTVKVPVGARIRLLCRGTSCPRRRWSHTATLVRARPFERTLAAGTRLIVTVTKRRVIGKYTEIVVRSGRPPARRDLCLYPGSSRPRRCPAA
jgi:hypothetical protein